MSTSVYNPLGLRYPPATDRPSQPRRGPQPAAVRRVSRVLFGPVDRAETHRFIEEELTKIRVSQSELWNFDFMREAQLDPQGPYEWRPATPPPRRPQPKGPRAQRTEAQDSLYHQADQEVVEARPRGGGKSPRPQRLITDYLKKKKSSSDYVKKDWPSAVERPAKLPRLSEMS